MNRQSFLASLFTVPFLRFFKSDKVIKNKEEGIERIIFDSIGTTHVKYKKGHRLHDSIVVKYPWLHKYVRYMQDSGIDITKIIFEMPDGCVIKFCIFEEGENKITEWTRYNKDEVLHTIESF